MKKYYPLLCCSVMLLSTFSFSQNCSGGDCKKKSWSKNVDANYSFPCLDTLPWKLVFEDDFNKDSLEDKTWQNCYPWGRELSNLVYAKEGYENLPVNNGTLKVIMKPDSGKYAAFHFDSAGRFYTVPTFYKYTGGMIYSKEAFTYGRFEIRCKISAMDGGQWPAFWLYGECAQEIDVFEFFGSNKKNLIKKAGRTVVCTYHRKLQCDDKCKCMFSKRYLAEEDLSKDFHVYAVQWDPYKIIWTLDGKEIYAFHRYKIKRSWAKTVYPRSCKDILTGDKVTENVYFPNLSMHMIVTNSMNTDYGIFPSVFEIDYIKAWQQ